MVVKKIAILFSGNGSNLEAVLEKLHNKIFNDIKIECVLAISNKARAYGIERAAKYGVEAKVINHKEFNSRQDFDVKLVELIKQSGAELVVLAGFMRILTPVFTEQVRAINLHPSILPLFKGATAILDSYQSDMQVGGVSVHLVSSELDGGKILAQRTFQREGKSLEEWEEKIHQIEHEILPQTILEILSGKIHV